MNFYKFVPFVHLSLLLQICGLIFKAIVPSLMLLVTKLAMSKFYLLVIIFSPATASGVNNELA